MAGIGQGGADTLWQIMAYSGTAGARQARLFSQSPLLLTFPEP